MTLDLQGRVAIVTGGARGMGAAEAALLAERGATVIVADVLDDEGAATAAAIGGNASYAHLDVTAEDEWARVVADAVATHGGVDVLVNNAGILRFAPIAMMSTEEYRKVIDVNQLGVFLGMRAVIPTMTAAGRGSIVNVSSVDGLRGTPGLVAYVASKFAVRGMTKVAALELGPSGVRVNSVHPGPVRTPMLEAPDFAAFDVAPFDVTAIAAKQTAFGRVGESNELAEVVAFLASDAASYCTGAEFVVDGGLTAGVVAHGLGT